MGTNSKAAHVGVLGSGRSLSHGRSRPRHQYLGRRLRRLSVTADADSAIRDGVSETATVANGWLTKMSKARLHLQQSGPD
jgi:hypothetical protein